ncbi:uncharacterized protein LOC144110118 isoform X1 [Amblyomma americanum]
MDLSAKIGVAVLVVAAAATCAAQKTVPMEECVKGKAIPGFRNLTIDPCDSDPCVIKRGERYNVTFFAEANADANVVVLSTSAIQQSNTTFLQIGQTVSCHFRDFPCNVAKGEVFRGSYIFGLADASFVSQDDISYWVQVGTDKSLFACGRTKLTIE